MTQDMIVSMIVAKVGEDEAKKYLQMIKDISDKLGDKVLMLSSVKGKGNCLFISSKEEMNQQIFKEKPKVFYLDEIINKIEI